MSNVSRKLDFGAAHIVLQSTWMVGRAPDPNAGRCRPARHAGRRRREHASSRAAQRYLKNVTVALVKSTDEGFALLRAGKIDVAGGSRESLVVLAGFAAGGSRTGRRLSQFVCRCRRAAGPPAALAFASAFVGRGQASVSRSLDVRADRSPTWTRPSLCGDAADAYCSRIAPC